MSTANTPQSQKSDAKPISFHLLDPGASAPVTDITLFVRPEELTRTDPSRTSVTQTLGGAWGSTWGSKWGDEFGAGIATINISGTTGWRTDSDAKDGLQRLTDLKTLVFDKWHAGRLAAYKNDMDPNTVQLIFTRA
jgi:hypothetical protein